MQLIVLIFVGLGTGICSGLFGIGGGVVLVPALVLLLRYTQHAATGTSLIALLLPVGALGAFEYYKAGKITIEHLKYGLLIAVGIFFGTYLGARLASTLPSKTLGRAFSVFLALLSVRLWFLAR